MGIINVRHIYTNDENEDDVEIVKFNNEEPEEIFFIHIRFIHTYTQKSAMRDDTHAKMT